MAWVVAAILAVLVVAFFQLYRKALNETNHIFSYAVLILLDQSVYETQKAGLMAFVRDDPSTRAIDLSSRAFKSMVNLANNLSKTSVLGAHAALWQLKQGDKAS